MFAIDCFTYEPAPRPWQVVTFGAYAGLSLPVVMLRDPDWFFFCYERGVFDCQPDALAREAAEVARQARRIRVKGRSLSGEPLEVEYLVSRGKLAQVRFVTASEPQEGVRKAVLDLSAARTWAAYDKTGSRMLVDALKADRFGSERARFTRERAEAFFADPSNFIEGCQSRALARWRRVGVDTQSDV